MVVTDVRGTQSGLVLTPELGGRITVREANGALVAELRKPAGNTIELGLDPGAYVVAMDSGSTIFQANVSLTAGKHTPLAAAAFHAAGPREATVARGDDGAGAAGRAGRDGDGRRGAAAGIGADARTSCLLSDLARRARRRARLLVRLRRRPVAARPRLPAGPRLGADRRRSRGAAALRRRQPGARQLRGRADHGRRQHPARRRARRCSWSAAATSSTAASSARRSRAASTR